MSELGVSSVCHGPNLRSGHGLPDHSWELASSFVPGVRVAYGGAQQLLGLPRPS